MRINVGGLGDTLNHKVDLEGSIQKFHIDTNYHDLNLYVNNNEVPVAFFHDCNPNRFEINGMVN